MVYLKGYLAGCRVSFPPTAKRAPRCTILFEQITPDMARNIPSDDTSSAIDKALLPFINEQTILFVSLALI